MDIFNVLTLIGGLCLFLFGMSLMGDALERRAGGALRELLGKITSNKAAGFLTGLGVTAVIQSSSATTVMVVGFVNSTLLTLKQAINVIMGANVGTTVTAWILSLGGIESSNVFVKLLKPTSFTPVLALIGTTMYMFSKNSKSKDTGTVLLGFATLMFGMDTMSGAVAGLKNVPAFTELFVVFKNPILGVLAGAILTAIIQSSSAAVGILQALAVTGSVSFGAAIPIIMGQNIGTCITAILSGIGANKNAKRAATVHLLFNVIGTAVWLTVFWALRLIVQPAILDSSATTFGIAIAHSVFNVLCTLLLFPMTGLLEKLVIKIVPDSKQKEVAPELDERLLATPPIALERCKAVATDMAEVAFLALKKALGVLDSYDATAAAEIRTAEQKSDYYEDILGTYLVKLSSFAISESDSAEAAKLLKIIGDFERISDHAVNILESAEEIQTKKIALSKGADFELSQMSAAVNEILDITRAAFLNDDLNLALKVEPLEQVIDSLKDKLRTRHILRLQQGECTIDAGFVWSDLLNNLERTSDHCSNIAGSVIDMAHHDMNTHSSLMALRLSSEDFKLDFEQYSEKYSV